jgi:hypothetical protein
VTIPASGAPLTEAEVEELERLAAEATPGPWLVTRDGWGNECHVNTGAHGHPGPFCPEVTSARACPTCRFISAARRSVGPLLATVRAQAQRLAQLEVDDRVRAESWAGLRARAEQAEATLGETVDRFREQRRRANAAEKRVRELDAEVLDANASRTHWQEFGERMQGEVERLRAALAEVLDAALGAQGQQPEPEEKP